MIVPARMAELVDALVSNTSGSNAVPVRSRLRVQIQTTKALINDRSRCFMSEKLALEYYNKLTSILSQGVSKSVAGVVQNTKVIVEYQPEIKV